MGAGSSVQESAPQNEPERSPSVTDPDVEEMYRGKRLCITNGENTIVIQPDVVRSFPISKNMSAYHRLCTEANLLISQLSDSVLQLLQSNDKLGSATLFQIEPQGLTASTAWFYAIRDFINLSLRRRLGRFAEVSLADVCAVSDPCIYHLMSLCKEKAVSVCVYFAQNVLYLGREAFRECDGGPDQDELVDAVARLAKDSIHDGVYFIEVAYDPEVIQFGQVQLLLKEWYKIYAELQTNIAAVRKVKHFSAAEFSVLMFDKEYSCLDEALDTNLLRPLARQTLADVHITYMAFSRLIFADRRIITLLLAIADGFARFYVRAAIPEELHVGETLLDIMSYVLQIEFKLLFEKKLQPVVCKGRDIVEVEVVPTSSQSHQLFDYVCRQVDQPAAERLGEIYRQLRYQCDKSPNNHSSDEVGYIERRRSVENIYTNFDYSASKRAVKLVEITNPSTEAVKITRYGSRIISQLAANDTLMSVSKDIARDTTFSSVMPPPKPKNTRRRKSKICAQDQPSSGFSVGMFAGMPGKIEESATSEQMLQTLETYLYKEEKK